MDLDLEDGNFEHEEQHDVPSPISPDHGDTLHMVPEITQSSEDRGQNNEQAIGGETLKTML